MANANENEKKNDTASAAPKSEAKKEKEYAVAIGALMVGKGDRRGTGSTVKASELSTAQLEYFINDGTLKAK